MPQLNEKWELLERTEKRDGRYKLFYEKWVHDESESGIYFFSKRHGHEKIFVVEGYGIGTVNIVNFSLLKEDVPIQRHVCLTEESGRQALEKLQQSNIKIWRRKLGLA